MNPLRRTLLQLTLGLSALTSITLLRAKSSVTNNLTQFFEHPGSALELGRQCLQDLQLPVEDPAAWLQQQLTLSDEDLNGSLTTLKHRIGQQSMYDFTHGRIVMMDGWMLSQTEVYMYALAACITSSEHASRYKTGQLKNSQHNFI
jgi:hypothetical protein